MGDRSFSVVKCSSSRYRQASSLFFFQKPPKKFFFSFFSEYYSSALCLWTVLHYGCLLFVFWAWVLERHYKNKMYCYYYYYNPNLIITQVTWHLLSGRTFFFFFCYNLIQLSSIHSLQMESFTQSESCSSSGQTLSCSLLRYSTVCGSPLPWLSAGLTSQQ